MTVMYQVQVMQVDRADWLADLRQAMTAELRAVGMHRSVVVDVSESSPAESTPSVAVVLVGPASKSDSDLTSSITEALSQGRVVVPVVEDLKTFHDHAPKAVSRYNGFEWSGERPQQRLARLLLEELGIEDRDRMVFLSHKRSDGLGAAEQLHDMLTHNRFVPFIDRFAIPPGEDVQDHIADALERYAFLLILETPEAHISDWVYDEIDYALSHTMGTLIVQWPNNPPMIPGSLGIPRFILTESDIEKDGHGYDILTESASDHLIREIEAAHAHGIVRRRRMLVSNVEEAAKSAGYTSTALKEWALDVTGPNGRSIVTIAPRLPAARDLQRLDETREQIAPNADALLIHASRQLREPTKGHLEWVTGTRNLKLLSENAIGAHW